MPIFPTRPGIVPGRFTNLTPDTTPVVLGVTPNSGRVAGGAAITITGSNFRNNSDGSAPTVLIGTFATVSVVVVDQFTITAVTGVATAAGLLNISVTNGSQVGTFFNAFTYYTSGVQAITPGYGPLAGGTVVLITGFNFVVASTVTIGGSSATSVNIIDDQHISCVTPAHAIGFTDVVVTEPLGATATLDNGFQYTLLTRGNDIRRMPGIVIHDALNNAPNTCRFVVDGTSNTPLVAEEIQIVDPNDGNRLLFAGTVQTVTQRYEDRIDQIAWDVDAIDFTWLGNKFRPVGAYVNVSSSDIVKDLVAKFAPGFTTAHVQTNLAPITATFDGSRDLSTCLSDIANAIGGGHWRWDYTRDLHFFHKLPPNIVLPAFPESVLRLGPGTAMTISEGARQIEGLAASFPTGFYVVRSTFVYSNGVESAMSPCSNLLAAEGIYSIQFAGIPIGPAVGALTCTKRRIYYKWFGNRAGGNYSGSGNEAGNGFGFSQTWAKGFEIPDNTTTDLNNGNSGSTWFGVTAPYGLFISSIPASAIAPFEANVAPPPAPTTQLGVTVPTDFYTQNAFSPQSPMTGSRSAIGYAMGGYQFGVAYLYRDGSVSLPKGVDKSKDPNYTIYDTVNGAFRTTSGTAIEQFVLNTVGLSNIPIGPTINSVDVIARFIYAHYLGRTSSNGQWNIPENISPWHIVPDNTSTTANVGPSTFAPPPIGVQAGDAATAPIPVWPNPDGPSLEDTDPPHAITDSDPDLLREGSGTPFRVTTDLSQVRNRIIVRGAGTGLSAKAVIGDVTIKIDNAGAFSPNGGTIFVQGQKPLTYFGVSAGSTANPNGTVYLATPLTQDLDQGTPLQNFLQVDDAVSQQALGKVELDASGNPTDGVHEYYLNDNSLTSPIQLYMRAHAELELFGRPILTINYSTRDPKSVSGQTVHVDLTSPPCKGDFLIQDVTIDQVHDESDTLFPRYTVTASSVKFDLNDLLLLIAQSIGSSPTQAQASTGTASISSTTSLSGLPRTASGWITGADATPQIIGIGTVGTITGANSIFDSVEMTPYTDHLGNLARRDWLTLGTSSVADNVAQVTFTPCPGSLLEEEFDLFMQVRTPKDLGIGIILWAGLFQGSPPNSTTGVNTSIVAIRYSNFVGFIDPGWVGILQPDGVSHTQTTIPLANIAPSTDYNMRIQSFRSGDYRTTQVIFTVNGMVGSRDFAGTANPPGSTTNFDMPTAKSLTANGPASLKVGIGVVNKLTTIRKFNFRRMTIAAK